MEVDEAVLAALAKVAGISLDTKDCIELAPRLRNLLGDADKVNAFMAPRREVGLAVRFEHLELPEGAERR
jgi:hypothetical protein